MGTEALNCISCGHDCSSLCGTKQFRSCCFNYFRKRSDGPPPRSLLRSNELRSTGYSSSEGPSLVSVASLPDVDSLPNDNNGMNNLGNNNIMRAVAGDQDLSPSAPSSYTARRGSFYPESLGPSIRHQYLLAEIP